MTRKAAHAPLNIFLNSRQVGQLSRAADGAIGFAYDRAWLDRRNAFGISLSLPLRATRYTGERVSAVFENLLPDDKQILTRVAERVGAAGTDAYSLLSQIGRDCVGALQFLPEGEAPGLFTKVEGVALDDSEIDALLRNLARAPLGLDEHDDFRISLAGAQEKTALLRYQDRWMKPVGTTATTHLFKPQIGLLSDGIDMSNSVENEYFCLKLMQAFGLETSEAEMATFGQTRTLVVKRFDRLWTGDVKLINMANGLARLPQEDFCQALSIPPTRKYESHGGPGIVQILDLLAASDNPQADQVTFLKSQIIFWLIGATDGHAKNFSIALTPGGRFRLTPIYDVLTIEPAFAANQIRKNKMKLAMAVGSGRHYRLDEIHGRHFVETARLARMPDPLIRRAIEEVLADCEHAFAKVIAALPGDFPASISETTRNAALGRLGSLGTAQSEWSR